jgi:hypothetical protein
MAKGKKPLNERSSASDFGPSERLQHTSGLAYERTSKQLGSKKRLRITNQTPLDRLHSRQQINQRQFDAGQRIYALWYKAGKLQRLTANYNAVIVDGGKAEESAGEAEAEYNAALKSVGRDLAAVLRWVCIHGSAPNEWAKENGHNPKSGVAVLRVALDAVGDYFRMPR